MKLIVGLGNPGKEYINTRHNIGFSFIDSYLKNKKISVNWSSKFGGLVFQTIINDIKVLFLKPQTYMNLSGDSVRKFVDYYHISYDDILVVSDDVDLNVGNFKLKTSGSCGGHNGLRNIEDKLESKQFKRLKIGVSKNDNYDMKDYVLGHFTSEEKEIIDNIFPILFQVLDDYFSLSFMELMNKYNHKNK